MARSSRDLWVTAGILGVSLAMTGALLIPESAAQTNNQPRPQHGIIQSTGGPEPGSLNEFLKVPVVNLIPGAIEVRPNIKNPMAEDPQSAARGMQYFVKFNCVGCHAPNGGGGMGPSLSNEFFKYGSHPANLFLTIAQGRPQGMPSWGALLPEQVIWDLVSYVQSISKEPKPSWGTTVSPAANMPTAEQIPTEFKQSATPWQFTERFGNGRAPAQGNSGEFGEPPESSGSSRQ